MNKTELDRLKELAEKATPGPWMAHVFLGPEVLTTGDIMGKYQVVIENEVIANCDNRNGDCAYIAAANPATILAMIAEIDRLQNENQYLRDWAKIDIDASKASLAFEEELASILVDPDTPEMVTRSEILTRVAGLEKEADWLANLCSEFQSQWLEKHGGGHADWPSEWRKRAREAVEASNG